MKMQCPFCQKEFDMNPLRPSNLSENEVREMNQKAIEDSIKRYKPKTAGDKRRKLRGILNHFYQEYSVKYLLDYDVDEIEDWLYHIENLSYKKKTEQVPLSYNAKMKYRTHLLMLVLYMVKHELRNPNAFALIAYWEYLLSDNFFHFTQSGNPRRIPLVDPQTIKDFIGGLLLQRQNFRDYITFGILCYSGCRVGGLVNLQVKDIDFKNATFQTQEKSTTKDSGWNTYFLPFWFMEYIQTYINQNNLVLKDYLIGVSDKQIRVILHKYKPEWWPHLFRHTLRINWELKGMSPIHAKFLQNHEPGSVDETYLQGLYDIPHLRIQYDRYFPY